MIRIFAVLGLIFSLAQKPQPQAQLGPSDIVFSEHIAPIFEKVCTECHGGSWPQEMVRGLDLATYGALMDGSYEGSVVTPGDVTGSMLTKRIEGRNGLQRMPLAGHPLPRETIALLRRWISEGAQADD